MNIMATGIHQDLLARVHSYALDENAFQPLCDALSEKLRRYEEGLSGPHISSHLSRVSKDIENFLKLKNFNTDDSRKVGHAFALHDLGKIMQDPIMWQVAEHKPVLTTEQKEERPNHTIYGPIVLRQTIDEMGLIATDDMESHLKVVEYLMVYHHERLDDSGPQGMSGDDMGLILQIATIVDTVDGKKKAKDLTDIFEDMSGRHKAQFNQHLVDEYKAYKLSEQAVSAPAPLANQAVL